MELCAAAVASPLRGSMWAAWFSDGFSVTGWKDGLDIQVIEGEIGRSISGDSCKSCEAGKSQNVAQHLTVWSREATKQPSPQQDPHITPAM